MNKQSAEEKIRKLCLEIDRHNYLYYVLAKPEMSDSHFDVMLEELIRLEREFPELKSPESPSQRVGGMLTKEFQSVVHKYPMLSLGNTYSREELEDFDTRPQGNWFWLKHHLEPYLHDFL